MPFSEPTIGQGGTYRALFVDGPAAVGASCRFSVTMDVGEEEWTQESLNDLFQALIDTVAANPQFEFVSATWNSGSNSTITLTPEPGEEPPVAG